ncbi:unnamed protein product, partial [Cladocopium goreaui]
AGNERFATGAVTAGTTSGEMRKALVKYNQAPHSAIIGCADSRVPVDTIFDATPGELFVLRNAGNTCTHAEGSMVGSLEFCTGKLGSRLIMVLGHTQCGAIAGATATHQAGGEVKAPGCALEGLLQGLASVAKEASDDLGPGVSQEKLVSHAVKVNVFNSMNFLLQFSEPIRDLVRKGELDIQGGIYHLETGRVEFLGRSPRQDELLSSKLSLPPSMAMGMVRTSEDGTLEPKVALKMLKDGNHRFVTGAPVLGKVDRHMREALALKGQAPHTAVVGCADSRVPLETVFDALPGDLFVLRNAGNTCTHAEGSTLGSLEFCTGALNTRLIFVLGHTNCGALKGATAAYLSQEKRANHALDVLLNELGSVVSEAKSQCGRNATADEIASKAVKLNVFHTMNFMLKHCDAIREKVRSGQLEIQGGVYDLSTGKVVFLGKSPQESKLIKGSSSVAPSLKHKIAVFGDTFVTGELHVVLIADALTSATSTCSVNEEVRKVRTTADPSMAPEDALELLKAQPQEPKKAGSALEGLLKDLGSVAQEAADELGPGTSSDEVAAHAVKVNVFHSMNFLLKFSDSIREAVKSGQ